MSKDELQFIADLTEKHQISFHSLLCILGSGAMTHAIEFLKRDDTEAERKMVDLEADIARAVGCIPAIEAIDLLEGSGHFDE